MAAHDHDMPPAGEPVPARQGYVLAVLVLVASLALVAVYAVGAGQRQQHRPEERTPGGGASLRAAIDRPSPRQWRNYADGLDLPRRFPAMLGLCYVAALSPAQLQEFQLEQRDATRSLFRVDPPGPRAEYGPVVLLEPQTLANADVIGFDMLTEPVQAEAMAAARER